MNTYIATAQDIKAERKWYVIDADGVVLGRLASQVANILRGKNKPIYTPNMDTGDYVIIKGTPNVNLCNSPEIEGGLGTIAMCVNMIPMVINAEAGLKTMIDLPIPRAIMGDFRNLIREEKKIVK